MGDYAEETGIGRKEPATVFNPQKPGQATPWTTVQDGVVQASFWLTWGLLWLALPKHMR